VTRGPWLAAAAAVTAVLAGCATTCPPPPVAAGSAPEEEEPAPAAAAPARRPAPHLEPPDGYVEVRVLGAVPSLQGDVLLLADPTGMRVVPVIIGEAEAAAINRRLTGEPTPRPMTHDLLDTLVERLGGEVVMVEVNKISEGIFLGTISVWDGHEVLRIDSRTSDAVAVAVGHGLPVLVAAEVIDESGVDASTLPPGILPGPRTTP